MKILVAIAHYGDANRSFLDSLIRSYQRMPWNVDICILSERPKSFEPNIQVRVGLPTPNPYSLPFAHRQLFAEQRDAYDLFIYSEDDTLVTEENVRAFLDSTPHLLPNEIAGFLRSEQGQDGRRFISSMHSFYRWDLASLTERGGMRFCRFTNDHSACYFVTRGQLARAIQSGGFLVPPHDGQYDMLVSAGTDIYTQCGLRRLLNLTRIESFILPHLTNKYVGKTGLEKTEFDAQIHHLLQINPLVSPSHLLCDPETHFFNKRFSKHLYEADEVNLRHLVPPQARQLLSFGCGVGGLEAHLRDARRNVLCVAVDAVFHEALRRRGMPALDGDYAQILNQLQGREFDCVLINNWLHLVPDAPQLIHQLARLLTHQGSLVLANDNTANPLDRLRGWLRSEPHHSPTALPPKATSQISPGHIRQWCRRADLKIDQETWEFTPHRNKYLRWLDPLIGARLANKYYLRAVKA